MEDLQNELIPEKTDDTPPPVPEADGLLAIIDDAAQELLEHDPSIGIHEARRRAALTVREILRANKSFRDFIDAPKTYKMNRHERRKRKKLNRVK